MERLKIGDKIYQENYGKITGIYTVDRLTKTLAVCKDDTRFRIEYSQPDWLIPSGDCGRFISSSYSLETPELKDRLYMQRSIEKIKSADLRELSIDKIREIMSIIEK